MLATPDAAVTPVEFQSLDACRAAFDAALGMAFSPAKCVRARRALAFAAEAHEGQSRKTGVPYAIHPVRVATIVLVEVAADRWAKAPARGRLTRHQAVLVALFHDLLEDTDARPERLQELSSATVLAAVRTLSKPPRGPEGRPARERTYHEALTVASDDVLVVKAADRLDNLRDLPPDNVAFVTRYSAETRAFYLPLFRARGLPLTEAIAALARDDRRP